MNDDELKKIAEKYVGDDLREATEGRDTFFHCEQCAETMMARTIAALHEAMRLQMERDCRAVCRGCRKGMPLSLGFHRWGVNGTGGFPCAAQAIRAAWEKTSTPAATTPEGT